jgi:hypothetical protein
MDPPLLLFLFLFSVIQHPDKISLHFPRINTVLNYQIVCSEEFRVSNNSRGINPRKTWQASPTISFRRAKQKFYQLVIRITGPQRIDKKA